MVDLEQLIKVGLSASILLLVIGLGMRATIREATSFIRHLFQPPYGLVRAIVAMNFAVPIVAATVAAAWDLPLPVKIAIVAMSISPVPPILPGKQLKFGGRESYVYGLLVAVSLVAILFVPLSVEVVGRLFDRDVHMSFIKMAGLIGRTILLPLTIGMGIRAFAPALAKQAGPWISKAGNLLLIASLIPVLIGSGAGIWSLIGDGTILAIVVVVAVAMAAGHWIGGPDEHDRTALAIVSAMRHPGVALAVGRTNFPDDKLIPAAILLVALVAVVTTTIYGKLRMRHLSGNAGAGIAAHA
jgi:BASS family bile acid:Na+ symporter